MSTSNMCFDYFTRLVLGICYGDNKEVTIKRKKERKYMIKKIKMFFLKFHIKWVKGECRHFCKVCESRPLCEEHWEDDTYWK